MSQPERRLAAIMFTDIVGYTKAEEQVSILEKLFPSDFNTIASRAYLSTTRKEKHERRGRSNDGEKIQSWSDI
ncbi:MAG: hypothetical protein ACYCQJ_10980 [Nitrososphaerales archaeon]